MIARISMVASPYEIVPFVSQAKRMIGLSCILASASLGARHEL